MLKSELIREDIRCIEQEIDHLKKELRDLYDNLQDAIDEETIDLEDIIPPCQKIITQPKLLPHETEILETVITRKSLFTLSREDRIHLRRLLFTRANYYLDPLP